MKHLTRAVLALAPAVLLAHAADGYDAVQLVTDYAGKPVPPHGCKDQRQQGTGGVFPTMSAAGLPDGGPPVPLTGRVPETARRPGARGAADRGCFRSAAGGLTSAAGPTGG